MSWLTSWLRTAPGFHPGRSTIATESPSRRGARGLSAQALEDHCLPSMFSVLSSNDDSTGSLRQAILDTNAHSGADLINFNIGGSGVRVIAVGSTTGMPLPDITDPVTIDGYSQPGASPNTLSVGDNAVLLIQLNGGSAGPNATGLHITAGNSTVRGLDITSFYGPGFSGTGIRVDTNGSNVIVGNFFGVDSSGTVGQSNGNYSVFLGASNNTLGGSIPAARNVISGFAAVGVYTVGDHNVVAGNCIGLKSDNSGTVGNLFGLRDDGTNTRIGGTTPGERNVISGSQDHGIILAGTAAVIEGNYIGTDATGMAAMPNGLDGVIDAGIGSIIGGLTTTPGAGAGNVFSGNGYRGIETYGASTIQGNIIGLNSAGTSALPNTLGGVQTDMDTSRRGRSLFPNSGVRRCSRHLTDGQVGGTHCRCWPRGWLCSSRDPPRHRRQCPSRRATRATS